MQEPLHIDCIMVQHFEEYSLIHSSVGGHGLGVQCQSISNTNYTSSYMSQSWRHAVSVGILKIRTIGFCSQSFTHSCLVISLQWKPTLDQGSFAVACPGGLKCILQPPGLVSLQELHLLSPVSPTVLHCQLSNKVKMIWKIISKKKKHSLCLNFHIFQKEYILSNCLKIHLITDTGHPEHWAWMILNWSISFITLLAYDQGGETGFAPNFQVPQP